MDVGAYVEASTDVLITDGNNDIIHACIALGPSGNRQGYINCFDLDKGRVLVRRTVKHMIWPERLLRKANAWKGQEGHFKGPNQFSEPKRGEIWLGQRQFDRNRDGWQGAKVGPAQLYSWNPGIEVKSDYEPIIVPKPNTEPEVNSSYVERAKKARKNYSRKTDVVTQSKTIGVDDDEDDASVI